METTSLLVWLMGVVLIAVGFPLFFAASINDGY
jgi:hypothetical protein